MPQTLNPSDRTAAIRVSSDRFEASSALHFGSIRALRPVPTCLNDPSENDDNNNTDSFYYEVELLSPTARFAQIGWAARQCFFGPGQGSGVGDDQWSVGFDGHRRCVWANGQHPIQLDRTWRAGDVIGCLLDLAHRTFVFYFNGVEYDLAELGIETHFNPFNHYYPAASFQCSGGRFNFGQRPFTFHGVPRHRRTIRLRNFYQHHFNRFYPVLVATTHHDGNIELSGDRLSARNVAPLMNSAEEPTRETIFATQYCLDHNRNYYFEVHVLSQDDSIQVGWSSSDGNNAQMILFDGFHRKLVSNFEPEFTLSLPHLTEPLSIGDVIGCALVNTGESDLDFVFYLNGVQIVDCDQMDEVDFYFNPESLPTFRPTISLAPGQHVYCNFGQERFRHRPRFVRSNGEMHFWDLCGNRIDISNKQQRFIK